MATLINGNGNLAIYAQQDADWYAALMGGQTVITAVGNQFAYELLASNTIGVKDGVIITSEGRRIQLDANAIDSFDIPTGAQGTTNYYIIGYHLVTGNQSEQTCETFVQLMENGTDTIPEGSFRDGDDEVFVSLYRVEQNDLTIGTITLLLPQLSGSFQSQITELNNDLTDNNKSFKFGYDSTTDKYGYYKEEAGADTFVPFKEEVPQQIKFLRDGITTYVSKTNGSLTSVSTSDNLLKIKNGTGLGTDEYFAFSENLYNLVKQVFGADVASVKFTMEHLTSKRSEGFGLKSSTSSISIGYPFFNVKQTDSDLSVTIDVETTLKNYKYLGTSNGDTYYWYIGNITIEKVI